MTTSFLSWVWRAWPVILTALVGVIHFTVLQAIPDKSVTVNKWVSVLLQLAGGFFVLYSIDKNLGTFRNKNLWQSILDWFRSFPVGKRPVTHASHASGRVSLSGSANATFEPAATTIEEKLLRLERSIAEVRKSVTDLNEQFNAEIHELRLQLDSNVSAQKAEMALLSSRMDQSLVGGFKHQAFGVLLVLYGSLLPALS